MKRAILFFLCCFALAITVHVVRVRSETLTVDTGTFTTGINTDLSWGYDPGYSWAEYSDTICELCGKAIAVQTKEAEQSWFYCVTPTSTRQWPVTQNEKRTCVLPWRFEIQHSLCHECAALADKELRTMLTSAHDEFWKQLIEKKAKDRADRNAKRKEAYRSSLEKEIAKLQKELKTIDEENEP